jgi:hypothetical protein
MRELRLVGLIVLTGFLGQPRPMGAQAAPFGEPVLANTPFAGALGRLFDRLEHGAMGRHLGEHPEDTTLVLAAMARISDGDFSEADDATLGAMVGLFRLSLDRVPEPLCARLIGEDAEDAFVEMLAASDSASAEAWATLFERMFVSAISPGRRSPPASIQEVQAALVPILLGLSEQDRALWLRQGQAPRSLSVAERCRVVRLVFGAFDDIPAVQRPSVIRTTMAQKRTASAVAGGH